MQRETGKPYLINGIPFSGNDGDFLKGAENVYQYTLLLEQPFALLRVIRYVLNKDHPVAVSFFF